jgi:thiol:disulfide interchange protein DsbA
MKKLTNWCLALMLSLSLPAAVAARDYMEGAEYLRLAKPQPTTAVDKVEVVELFWYACPHCFYLEPHLGKWLENKPEDVEFVRLPAVLGKSWELLGKAYFTAELLDVVDRIHVPLFEAIHVKKQKFRDVAAVEDFFVSHGVAEKDFRNTFHSFAVAVKINNAKLMTRRYAISGVPTLIVNGKFSTGASIAGSNEDVIKVVDFLVEQERAADDAPAQATVDQP